MLGYPFLILVAEGSFPFLTTRAPIIEAFLQIQHHAKPQALWLFILRASIFLTRLLPFFHFFRFHLQSFLPDVASDLHRIFSQTQLHVQWPALCSRTNSPLSIQLCISQLPPIHPLPIACSCLPGVLEARWQQNRFRRININLGRLNDVRTRYLILRLNWGHHH